MPFASATPPFLSFRLAAVLVYLVTCGAGFCWVTFHHCGPWSTLWGRETFCSRVGVKAAGSGAPEARIHNHARYMHGKDRNMRKTCDRATWSSLPVPKSETKEERVLLLVYLLVEVHVVDPSIIVLLGSEGARKYKCSPSK